MTAEERFNRIAALNQDVEVEKTIAESNSELEPEIDWRKVGMIRALEIAEKRFADRTSKFDATGGGQNLEVAIFAALHHYGRLTHKQVLSKIIYGDNQLAWKTIDRLIEQGKIKTESVKGDRKTYKLLSVNGIPYGSGLYSLRELAAHRDNGVMHGEPLSYRTIDKRLKAGLSPTLALLRPRQARRKW